MPAAIAAADLDGDGHVDLVVSNQKNSDVSVLLGNGNGSFRAGVNYASAGRPAGLLIHDMNGDGRLDIVVTTLAQEVSVLSGNGDGTFQLAANYSPGGVSVAIADFNLDGKPDILTADGPSAGCC
jgi:hypothetical protein